MESQTTFQPGTLCFRCNICGEKCLINGSELQREQASCSACNSSARTRAIVRTLSVELFGENLALPDFPVKKELRGLGMTDSEAYAKQLAEKFSYENTYLHQEPYLDISAPEVAPERLESSDFIVSSEIFEHVVPPVQIAFQNTFKMLKPGGILVLTVPYGTQAETVEHFPELYDFTIIADNDSYRLKNVTRSGEVQEFHDLIFHGGPGSTLEMRVFAEGALLHRLAEAGFEAITVHRKPDFLHGIWWPEPWSFPFSARRPRSNVLDLKLKA
jgi:SAM-dependent methyltransferase